MKKHSLIFNLLGVALCGLSTPLAAFDFCGTNNCCYDWSFCDGKIRVGAEWLYWKLKQENLDPASIGTRTTPEDEFPTNFQLCKQNLDPKFRSGFRVYLGYELPCDCWDVNLIYTYMPGKATISERLVSDNQFVVLNPAFFFETFGEALFFSLDALNSFKAKWTMTLNNIDVDIGRTICFGECLKLRPHIGFRALWFDQTLRFGGDGIFFDFQTDEERNGDFAYTFKSRYRGYGIEGGLWSEWEIGCGLSFVGHFGGSILYSRFRNGKDNELFLILENGPEDIDPLASVNICESKRWCATPTLDYFAGLKYEDCYCDTLFAIYVGWEQHVWFDINQWGPHGNLISQGVTLGANVAF